MFKHSIRDITKWRTSVLITICIIGGLLVFLGFGLVKMKEAKAENEEIARAEEIREQEQEEKYNKALRKFSEAEANGDPEGMRAAEELFRELGDYKEASTKMEEASAEREVMENYQAAKQLLNSGDAVKAAEAFHELGEHGDAHDQEESIYGDILEEARSLANTGEYGQAKSRLQLIPSFSDHYSEAVDELNRITALQQEATQKAKYDLAVEHFNASKYSAALEEFRELGEYVDSSAYFKACGDEIMKQARTLRENREYPACVTNLNLINDKNEYPSGYSEAAKMITEVTDEYRTMVKTTAIEKLEQEGYAAMKSYLSSVDSSLFTKNMVNEMLTDYQPVPLSDIPWFDHQEYDYVHYQVSYRNAGPSFLDSVVDENGASHTDSLVGGGMQLSFYLGKKYRTFTGQMFVLENMRATQDEPVFLEVADENGNILYSDTLMSGFPVKKFSIDVSNADQLILRFDGECDYASAIFGSGELFGGLGELYLIP